MVTGGAGYIGSHTLVELIGAGYEDDERIEVRKRAQALIAAGVIRRPKDGVRLLGDGELTAKLNITVAGASKTAVDKVEKAGGSVTATAVRKSAATAEA